ncbi:peptidoglycan DD-metalloendopeptidase family protein [Carnobacterium sp. PL12RED10]|uniref:peptidoglycan DD-metalloendopeptidase family protein n=1 Tax=Carnobacterium sp. PL12RED10 TaxID=2592351 RepID=UPI0011EC0279|nr:peptidoglycan DD-metalloendopeptidase family protein [Carnobacterium sp. PL12RED10]KAF3299324.1 peptidoglycan DD-metalloendopeptidase family protein [Carnobacterium sp. PL12RED10]
MVERIEGMSIEMSLNALEAERGVAGLRDRMRTLDAEMRNSLSSFDKTEKSAEQYGATLDGLSKKVQVQERVVKASKEQYEKMVAQYGEGSKKAEAAKRSYENQSATLNGLNRRVEKTTQEFEAFKKEQDLATSSTGKFIKQAEESEKTLKKYGDGLKGFGDKATKYVTAPLLGIGGLLLKQASDVESSQVRIQNSLGLTEAEAEKVYASIRKVYQDGWGESLEEVENTAEAVLTQLKNIDDPEQLQNAIKNAQLLADTFEMDTNEALRGVNALMETYGMTADEAFDYMVVGAQKGLDKTDELGDNLSEYAPLLKDAGYEADEMFAALTAGLDAGAYNLDKVNDLIKEFAIRVGDNTIQDAIADMGGEWQSIYDTWEASGGTVDDLFRSLGNHLASIKDPQEKQNALTEIWGSIGEDAGAKVVEGIAGAEDAYENVAGAAEKATKSAEQTFGERSQKVFRKYTDTLLPVGEKVLDLAEDYLPKLTKSVEGLTQWVESLDEDSVDLALKLGGIAIAAGPLSSILGNTFEVMSWGSGHVKSLTQSIAENGGLIPALTAKGTGLVSGLSSVVGFLTNPWVLGIGAGVLAITGLTMYLRQDAIKSVDDFGNKVSDTTTEAVTSFMDLSNEAQSELDYLFYSGAEITDEGGAKLISKFDTMHETLITSVRENYNEQRQIMTDFFADSSTLTEEQERSILERMNQGYQDRETALEEYHARENEITQSMMEENRGITEAEYNELANLRTIANDYAITELTASEEEQLVIREMMSQQKGEIDAQTAANTVARSKEAKEASIADAQTTYEERIASAIFQRDEMGTISAEEADALIADAERQRDESINKANEMHLGVVEEAQKQAEGHINKVNWETGEVLSLWGTFWQGVFRGFRDAPGNMASALSGQSWRVQNAIKDLMNGGISKVESGINSMIRAFNVIFDLLDSDLSFSRVTLPRVSFESYGGVGSNQSGVMQYATGTDAHPGGPAMVGDGGMKELIALPTGQMFLSPDTDTLVDLPKGTEVLSGPKTKTFMKNWGIPQYEDGIGTKIWEWVGEGAKGLLGNVLGSLGISTPSATGTFGTIAHDGFNLIKSEALDYLKGFIDKLVPVGVLDFAGLTMTSGFGWRPSPGGIGPSNHKGVDFAGPVGTPIPSQTSGRVVASAYGPERGNYVHIRSGLYDYKYYHFLRNLVSAGQDVKRGQTIGLLGNTGLSTGPHVHFQVERGGAPINPLGFATGGLVGHGLYELGEEGYPEYVIPTDPNRRTEAMKLLALAGKDIESSKRPNELPNVTTNSTDNDKLDTMIALLTELNNKEYSPTLLMQLGNEVIRVLNNELQRINGRDLELIERGLNL